MIEMTGNIWDIPCDWIMIPTNCTLDTYGQLVMGAGLAKQARQRISDAPTVLGDEIRRRREAEEPLGRIFKMGEFNDADVFAFPVKNDWRHPASLDLIGLAALSLSEQVERDDHGEVIQKSILLPRVGCGLGRLDWERQVKPVIEAVLSPLGDVVCIVSPEGAS